jgi:hypothetical protein
MVNYSVEVCKALEQDFAACQVDRPLKHERYDPGAILTCDIELVSPVVSSGPVRATLRVDKFAGSGFAGQVYKVTLLSLEGDAESSLEPGSSYALKIMVPSSKGAAFFRNLLFAIGYQAPFQLQVNPAAVRVGALWQEFIRRAAAAVFGDEKAVNRIHATLVDHTLGSCAEISDWVDGRAWGLEVDEHVDVLSRWERGQDVPADQLGSPEYRAKKSFMSRLVELLHTMGAPELARQYEWSTWKSQPNVLKRLESEHQPEKGLTAIDFRAGLVLLPFLPMSPADVRLIFQGLRRGSLVQFDRGDVARLQAFTEAHPDEFQGMQPMLEELKRCNTIYRDSMPDLSHNLFRLAKSRMLWHQIGSSTVEGWQVRNRIDQPTARRLLSNKLFFLVFALISLVPILGAVFQKYIGRPDYRSHYRKIFLQPGYLGRAISARRCESLLDWYRSGRVSEETTGRISRSYGLYFYHLLLAVLPVTVHRMLSDAQFLRRKLYLFFVRPVRIYFDEGERRLWLQEMVTDGKERGIISSEDESEILSQVNDPYIHRYLRSLAVHVALSPTTHVVSAALAGYYLLTHPDMPRAQAYAVATGIIALFQVIPISPGSLARGVYVLFVAIKEKNFKDYSIALVMAFFKYIGYLAFPVQMAYRYPAMARFMAGYWATNMVHIVPVFGESGALLEHKIFRLFYNLPLTLRRKMGEREALRRLHPSRSWHAAFIVIIFAFLGAYLDSSIILMTGSVPTIGQIAPALVISGFLGGFLVNLGSGGASYRKRLVLAVSSGLAFGALLTILSYSLSPHLLYEASLFLSRTVWVSFITATLSTLGSVTAEFRV